MIAGTGPRIDGRAITPVPVITDEQRLLLEYAARHAQGRSDSLFGPLANFKRDLRLACDTAKVEHLSPHDLRRAAGQWLIDLGMPLELVSRAMGHRDVRITQQVYASVREEDLANRMLDAVGPAYATRAHVARGKVEPVPTIKSLPEPKSGAVLHELNGTSRTLAEWASGRHRQERPPLPRGRPGHAARRCPGARAWHARQAVGGFEGHRFESR
jgi:hypothetical protein